MKPLFAIVAASPDGGIGYMGQIPWNLPGDLKRFKDITMNNIVIMGRRTFESLPKGLPGRQVVVVSEKLANGAQSIQQNVHYAKSLTEAIEKAQELTGKEIYIAGGARLYEEAMGLPCQFVLTVVYQEAREGYDTYIKGFNFQNYNLVYGPEMVFTRDQETNLPQASHAYCVYSPKKRE